MDIRQVIAALIGLLIGELQDIIDILIRVHRGLIDIDDSN